MPGPPAAPDRRIGSTRPDRRVVAHTRHSRRCDAADGWRRLPPHQGPGARLTLKTVSDLHELLEALSLYRTARHALLTKVGVPLSNRDPLAELDRVFRVAVVTYDQLVLVTSVIGSTYSTRLSTACSSSRSPLQHPWLQSQWPWITAARGHRSSQGMTMPAESRGCARLLTRCYATTQDRPG